jgi:hypothetical protein
MTLQIVEERLDELICSSRAKVLLLTGGWGAGKTYQWKQALQRAATTGKHARYAYVSLFGLTSLTEVRKRVSEEMVSTFKISDKDGTLGDVVGKYEWKLKPTQLLKMWPVLPYIGKLEGLANELSFQYVHNAIVCFDDLERSGTDLQLADVIGLASFLKEERNCKVILITNQDKINEKGKDDLLLYLEKVIDETVNFAPTPDEACDIALGEADDPTIRTLRDCIKKLTISNIRVISRLKDLTQQLDNLLRGLHIDVLRDAIQSLVLYGAAYYLPADGFPTIEYLVKRDSNDFERFFREIKDGANESEEDRKLTAWDQLLSRYGYGYATPLHLEIGKAIQLGYFDRHKLHSIARELSNEHESNAVIDRYHDAWDRFYHSLTGSGEELLQELREITIQSLHFIGPGDLVPAYEAFLETGHENVAEELLNQFITINQDRPKIFNQIDGPFGDKFKGRLAELLREESDKHLAKQQPSIEEALDRIDLRKGWTAEDIRVVSKITPEQIEQLLRESESRQFRARLITLLNLGKLNTAGDEEKKVTNQTIELLKRLSDEDPITAIRMRHYIPAQGGRQN